jgi:UDP-glucuronate 4-epimerase
LLTKNGILTKRLQFVASTASEITAITLFVVEREQIAMKPSLSTRKRVLVTGAAGFIGFHVASRLLQDGWTVLGIDSFSDYYDVRLKEARSEVLQLSPGFELARLSIDDRPAYGDAWARFEPDVVVHLAAQAGVRYSIDHPDEYISANLIGSHNTFELARHHKVSHLVAASTSSVYGANTETPFQEIDRAVHPVSLYAATKGSMELIGHAYSHLFNIPMTFFRFFTVYGPWGRPDMAPMKFARAILAGEPIEMFNGGEMMRDFTYVDDLVEALVRLIDAVPAGEALSGDTLSPVAPYRVVNIAGGHPIGLKDFIAAMEKALGKPAIRTMAPMQPGDVIATDASTKLLQQLIGTVPETSLAEGLEQFAVWYRQWSSGRA